MNYHFIWDKIQDGLIMTKFITSAEQLADIFNKPLEKKIFSTMIRKLGVFDIHSQTREGVLRKNQQYLLFT